ncbi:IS1634 family transposase [Pseudonocardia sp. ICBG601]|uniref:IS1634 family transposase n=1 Tax=Pseudonocardia sp. ICBG601 TaxID=2846759 RepID=UPI001CF70020|nr:IS1634 family transposase [Pseudonocardia sp. ICBG601]
MAWVRRVRTASGATAVQIAESVQGHRRIVAHVGSAHTEAELGLLVEQARGLIDDAAQQALDLGVAPSPRRAELIAPTAAGGATQEGLFGQMPRRAPSTTTRRVGAPQVITTGSRVLFDILAEVYAGLGFAEVADDTFRDLVIARIVEPTSILDTGRVLAGLGVTAASEKTMRRTLLRCTGRSYRDEIARACFTHARGSGDVSLCLYDVTTLYFEAEKEDDLRKVGFSKERRVDPQVVVGLLVDRAGFPLEIGCFEGNKTETATILPIIEAFRARHQLPVEPGGMVVVADAGMLSAANLRDLDEAGLRFIVGSRLTKAPVDLESHFHWHGDAFVDGQIIDTLTPRDRRTGRSENSPKVKAEPVWNPNQHPGSWRAVWAYSTKRAVRDRRTLTLQENRAREVIAGEKPARTPRFVKVTNGSRALDEASLARAYRLVGLKGYVTNIPAGGAAAGEIIGDHDLWHVEQSFRMSKTDLRARPMFHHQRQSIEAHLTIVFTALAVAREIQNRTGLTIRNVVRQLRPLRSATIAINGTQQTFPPAVPADKQALLDALRQPAAKH